jgi:hypothetical protein
MWGLFDLHLHALDLLVAADRPPDNPSYQQDDYYPDQGDHHHSGLAVRHECSCFNGPKLGPTQPHTLDVERPTNAKVQLSVDVFL